MNNTKKLPTTGIKPAIESFFAISVCHFCNQSGCKGIIFIDYSYSAGGFGVKSYSTRLMPGTSAMMRCTR